MMIKTQVQIPDYLYDKAKQIARQREMSFAEVIRRGLEYMVSVYIQPEISVEEWSPPKIQKKRFKSNIDSLDLREISDEDETNRLIIQK